jgi:hypothetical protein
MKKYSTLAFTAIALAYVIGAPQFTPVLTPKTHKSKT